MESSEAELLEDELGGSAAPDPTGGGGAAGDVEPSEVELLEDKLGGSAALGPAGGGCAAAGGGNRAALKAAAARGPKYAQRSRRFTAML